MSRLPSFAALALVLATASPARAEETVLLGRPAADALVTPAGFVLLTPDQRAVVGLDRRGQRLWHRTLEGGTEGPRWLHPGPTADRFAVAVGDRFQRFAVGGGAPRGELALGPVAAPGRPGCALEERGGACAVSCPCDFQIVHCDTLAPLGPRFSLPRLEQSDAAGVAPLEGGAARCTGRGGALVGRAGDVVVASVPGERGPRSALFVPHRAVGVSAASGAVVWSDAALGAAWPSPTLSGVSPDGETCWIGAADGRLDVFACATGALRWSARGAPPRGAEAQADFVGRPGEDPGLLVRVKDGVERRRLSDGHVVWRIDAPGERVLPEALGGAVHLGASAGVRVVDAASGATRADFAVPAGGLRELARVSDGWLVAAGQALVRYDEGGRERARFATGPVTAWSVGDGAIALRSRSAVTVVERERLLPVFAHETGSAAIVGLEGALGRNVIALLVHPDKPLDPHDPESMSELRVVRFR